jgi:Protein of unknown function (DUF1569)
MSLLEKEKRENIISRINRLNGTESAGWGKMNANQMVCHVTDQFRIALGEKGQPEKKAGLLGRTLIKFLVLKVIPIPKNVPTSPKVDQMKDGTPPTDFESDRQTLLGYIEKFTTMPDDFAWIPHFKFGTLSKKEWAILAHKHLDHHLKQFGV